MAIYKDISKLAKILYTKDNFDKVPQNCKEVENIKEYFGLEDRIDALVAAYFINFFIEEGIAYGVISDLCRDLSISYVEAYSYLPNLDHLLQKGIFSLRNNIKYEPDSVGNTTQFTLDTELIDFLAKNRPFSDYKPYIDLEFKYDVVTFFYEVANCSDWIIKSTSSVVAFIKPYLQDPWIFELIHLLSRMDRQFKTTEKRTCSVPRVSEPLYDANFLIESANLENSSKKFYLSRNLAVRFFLTTISSLKRNGKTSAKDICQSASFTSAEIMCCLHSLKEGYNALLEQGYIAVDKTNIADNLQITWGEKVLDVFKDCPELILMDNTVKELNKISCADIKEKQLFYNTENQKDIDRLENIMSEENYISLRERLKEKNLPVGLTILLHGAPGTGKTETVMQLAKKTGRDVYHLNIEQVKSCWVGESEKNIKNIFTAYYNAKTEKKPVLLFNEADAIVSKRTSVDGENAAVVKMENAIQNLLLEELEKFDGIFIATTNLVDNIDVAFDRRLLFKLKFENPTVDVKAKIWKSKLDFIDDDTAMELSKQFDLSGGQIDNIFRKSEIDYILYGEKPSKETLIDFCRKEKLSSSNVSKIGFF